MSEQSGRHILVKTKLYRPPFHAGRLLRPRLHARLDEAFTRRLLLLSAPAGFGKTTLLVDWIAEQRPSIRIVCWLSLDEGDNDPGVFWDYVLAAFAAGFGQPEAWEGLRGYLRPQPGLPEQHLEGFLAELVNRLAEIEADILLVLDDYHLVQSQAVHRSLAAFIGRLPPNLHLILSTRTDPPLPLARLRVQGDLAELRAADLQFTPDEALAYCNDIRRLDLAEPDLALLQTHTEGWAAGLQLAALALQNSSPHQASRFIRAFGGGHPFVLEYLVQEVLERQPPGVQDFLLRTSILSRLCGGLCDAVTGQTGGAARLAALEGAGLFTAPLDDEGRWYRYHPLLRETLLKRLQEAQPAGLAELHRCASAWLEQNGLTAEAIRHALAGEDPARAARLIEDAAHAMIFGRGEVGTLLKWIESLPAAEVAGRPGLCVAQAWACLYSAQPARVEACIQVAEKAGPDERLQGEISAVRARLAAINGEMERTISLSLDALQKLPQSETAVRALLLHGLGVAYRFQGSLEPASQAFRQVIDLSSTANPYLAINAMTHLGIVLRLQGRLRQEAELYERALALSTNPKSGQLSQAASVYMALSGLLLERGQLAEAEEAVRKGLSLNLQAGIDLVVQQGYVQLALVKLAQGDASTAHETLQQAGQISPQPPSPLTGPLLPAVRVLVYLEQGELAPALAWAESQDPDQPSPIGDFRDLVLARVRVAQAQMTGDRSRLSETVRRLERLRHASQASGQAGVLVEVLVELAMAHHAQGDLPAALDCLRQALRLGSPEGFVQTFVSRRQPAADLLARLLHGDPELRAYARQLLDALAGQGIRPQMGAGAEAGPSLAYSLRGKPLSQREVEILRLIESGATNQQIAAALFISVGTIKSHLNRIYEKLGASNRTDAVTRGRDQGLI